MHSFLHRYKSARRSEISDNFEIAKMLYDNASNNACLTYLLCSLMLHLAKCSQEQKAATLSLQDIENIIKKCIDDLAREEPKINTHSLEMLMVHMFKRNMN